MLKFQAARVRNVLKELSPEEARELPQEYKDIAWLGASAESNLFDAFVNPIN